MNIKQLEKKLTELEGKTKPKGQFATWYEFVMYATEHPEEHFGLIDEEVENE